MIQTLSRYEKAELCPVHDLEDLIRRYNNQLLSLQTALEREINDISSDGRAFRRRLQDCLIVLDDLAAAIKEKRDPLQPGYKETEEVNGTHPTT